MADRRRWHGDGLTAYGNSDNGGGAGAMHMPDYNPVDWEPPNTMLVAVGAAGAYASMTVELWAPTGDLYTLNLGLQTGATPSCRFEGDMESVGS